MATRDSSRPGGRRRPVEVVFFPKQARAATRTSPEWSRTLTVPEFALGLDPDEPVTEALGVPAFEDPPKPAGRRTRRRTPASSEKVTEPGATVDLAALCRAKDPTAALRKLSRRQLNEVTLAGHRLFEQGRLDQARVLFEGLVGLSPQESFAYTMLGTIFLGLEEPDRALALFEAALGLDRSDLAARVYRGEIRLQRGKHKQAQADLDLVVEFGAATDPFVQRARRLLRLASAPARKPRR